MAEKYRGAYMLARTFLTPIGALGAVAGLVVGVLFGFWLLLPIGLLVMILGLAAQAGIMMTIEQDLKGAGDDFVAYTTDPEELRQRKPETYAKIKQLVDETEREHQGGPPVP